MKIHTFTVVVGNRACNLRCPYCISKLTPFTEEMFQPVKWRNFGIACRLAQVSGVTTVLLTGKGEPTLDPFMIGNYLKELQPYNFPFIELQTNGVLLDPQHPKTCLKGFGSNAVDWYRAGMTLVCISVAHYDAFRNNELLEAPRFNNGKTFDYWRAVNELHEIGFSVRINCTMVSGGVDSPQQLEALRTACQDHGVEQITVRMVTKPDESENEEVANWVHQHQFDDSWVEKHILETGGTHLLNLPHGGKVFDWRGQNICAGNCLTGSTDPNDIRQLIFFPNGTLAYDWRFPGAVIL